MPHCVVKLDLVYQLICLVDGACQRRSPCRHSQHATTRRYHVAVVQFRASVKHLSVLRRCLQAGDRESFFVRTGIPLRRHYYGSGETFIPQRQLSGQFSRGQSTQEIFDIGNRVPRWDEALEMYRLRPVTGYGFLSGRFAIEGSATLNKTGPLHNGYMEVLVGLGLIGVVVLGFILFRVGRWAVTSRAYFPARMLLFALLLYSSASTGFGGSVNLSSVLLMLIAGLADIGRPIGRSRQGSMPRSRLWPER